MKLLTNDKVVQQNVFSFKAISPPPQPTPLYTPLGTASLMLSCCAQHNNNNKQTNKQQEAFLEFSSVIDRKQHELNVHGVNLTMRHVIEVRG